MSYIIDLSYSLIPILGSFSTTIPIAPDHSDASQKALYLHRAADLLEEHRDEYLWIDPHACQIGFVLQAILNQPMAMIEDFVGQGECVERSWRTRLEYRVENSDAYLPALDVLLDAGFTHDELYRLEGGDPAHGFVNRQDVDQVIRYMQQWADELEAGDGIGEDVDISPLMRVLERAAVGDLWTGVMEELDLA